MYGMESLIPSPAPQLLEDLVELLSAISSLQRKAADPEHRAVDIDRLEAVEALLTDIIASTFYGLPKGSCL